MDLLSKFFTFVPVIFLSVSCSLFSPVEFDQDGWNTARAKWNSFHLSNYRFHYYSLALLSWPTSLTYTVQNGKVVSVISGVTNISPNYPNWINSTMEGVFDSITNDYAVLSTNNRSYDMAVYKIMASYDAVYGYPTGVTYYDHFSDGNTKYRSSYSIDTFLTN